MEALPAFRVSRLHSGPIAADPIILLSQRRGLGTASQIAGLYTGLAQMESRAAWDSKAALDRNSFAPGPYREKFVRQNSNTVSVSWID